MKTSELLFKVIVDGMKRRRSDHEVPQSGFALKKCKYCHNLLTLMSFQKCYDFP